MAIKISKSSDSFKYILRSDDAIGADVTDEDFEAYKKTGDESILRLTKEPTRFVLRKNLPYAAQQAIANCQISVGAGGKPTFQFGYMLEEVRFALSDIENATDIAENEKLIYTKALDGGASYELIAMLNSAGYVAELFSVRQEKMAANPAKK